MIISEEEYNKLSSGLSEGSYLCIHDCSEQVDDNGNRCNCVFKSRQDYFNMLDKCHGSCNAGNIPTVIEVVKAPIISHKRSLHCKTNNTSCQGYSENGECHSIENCPNKVDLITQYDKLCKLSTEEYAQFMVDHQENPCRHCINQCNWYCDHNCKDGYIKWLDSYTEDV